MARRSYASFGNADYGIWYRFAAVLVKPVTTALVKPDWRGWENFPKEGGFLTVVNHNSVIDPVVYAHFQYNSGRPPRILGKSSLFKVPFIGFMLRKTGQIPVYRDSTDAAMAFRAAIEAINNGQVVQFYPEGTITRDPQLWPMTGKSGAARVALMTGAPVIRWRTGARTRSSRPTARAWADGRPRPACSRARRWWWRPDRRST